MGTQLSRGRAPDPRLDGVSAVVLTHLRPRLASATVRALIDVEGFEPGRVVVVVNGPGGLDDPVLEDQVRMVRLPDNLGPAGGFRRGMLEAFADASVRFAYVCEDDMVLLHLPAPRVAELVERLARNDHGLEPVGAVVAFGRRFVARSGHARVTVPRRGLPGELAPVDVSTWGATLVSRAVVDAGIVPDESLFFGFEDFDFYCRVRAAGLSVLVDVLSARHVAHLQTLSARDAALRHHRPVDAEEPWRAYYFARNFFALARRHGRRSWIAWHVLYSVRRLQLASSSAERRAVVRGLLDGARGRLGVNPRYVRRVGERAGPGATAAETPETFGGGTNGPADLDVGASTELTQVTSQPAVVALVLSHNAPETFARCLDAIASQTTPPDHVIVVDNASEPPVRIDVHPGDGVRNPGAPSVSVVRSDENLGPAGGWAIAFERFLETDYDHAWVLDDDMVADPTCLQVLMAEAAKDPKRAFLFPYSVQPDGSVGWWSSWCGFVIARPVVEDVGIPRAELFWWAEDTEYCHWRVPHAGYDKRVVGGALVQHDAVRRTRRVPEWKYYYEARNMLYLHLHVMRRVGWYPRNVTKLVARAALRERGGRVRSLIAIGRGLVDGARGRLGIRVPVEPMREQGTTEGVRRHQVKLS